MSKPLLWIALAAFFLVSGASGAHAFCVTNGIKGSLHVESLGSDGFVADIVPMAQTCCPTSQCAKPTTLLIVSGYVPVAEGRPGWTAECRAKVKPGNTISVTGSVKKITCGGQ
ncbi:hypothetical protein [Magnetospira sp. QH-2]|uniref:hypothetical protein n=1 Tax=Magnetospira sp. (strain QH-2) TaxID=1288970 RepID=UPI0003E80CC2|nr:hypothetical protein [Magnetospira sp. QH-2]CCQ75563.1 exported protein of unknown function [Magnetospira sp. QH-2]